MRFLIFAGLALWPSIASAAEPPASILEPSSPWAVDYAENNCRLIRTFGTDKNAVKLVFEQVAPRSTITVLLLGDFSARAEKNILAFSPLADVASDGGQKVEPVNGSGNGIFWSRGLGRGKWGLIPDTLAGQMRKSDPVAAAESPSAPWEEGTPRVKWSDHRWSVEPEDQWQQEDAAFSARADQVTAVVLNPGRSKSISLDTGPLAKPLEALEQCATDSLKDWGIDPAVEATIVKSAHSAVDGQTLFTSEDYPQAALQAAHEDTLQVWLNIDAQGGIASCRVISDFATPEINGAICDMVRRKQKFVPARAKDGTPVPDYDIETFNFRLAG